MIVPTFQVNLPMFERALADTVARTKRSILDEYRLQAKLLFDRIINWRGGAIATPPRNLKQGKGAVHRDIYSAVFPLRSEGFNDVKVRDKVREAIASGDLVKLQSMAKAGVFGDWAKAAIVDKFYPKMHTSQRRSRGRVPIHQRYNFATPDTDGLKAYVTEVQGRVGQGKGGWASSLRALGGKVQKWIAVHERFGSFIDNLKPGRAEMMFTGINKSAWASGGDEDRIIEMAMKGRAMAMHKAMAIAIEKAWERHEMSRRYAPELALADLFKAYLDTVLADEEDGTLLTNCPCVTFYDPSARATADRIVVLPHEVETLETGEANFVATVEITIKTLTRQPSALADHNKHFDRVELLRGALCVAGLKDILDAVIPGLGVNFVDRPGSLKRMFAKAGFTVKPGLA